MVISCGFRRVEVFQKVAAMIIILFYENNVLGQIYVIFGDR